MVKNKYIIVLFLMFLLSISDVSASSIDYELKITNDRHFYETITYNIESDTKDEHLLNVVNGNVYFDINETVPYTKTVGRSNGDYVVVLKKDYLSNNVKNSKLLNDCFKEFFYDENNYKITYYATEPFRCFARADKITVSVVTDLNVILDTADEVIGNKYIWNKIDEEFSMDLSLGESDPNADALDPITDAVPTPSDDIDDWPDGDLDLFPYNYVIAGGIAIVLIASFVIVLRIRSKKANN